MMFENLFNKKVLNINKALIYGFQKVEEGYIYKKDILDNQFCIYVTFSKKNTVAICVIDKETSEEYVLYKTSAEGAFVGKIRECVYNLLEDIARNCCNKLVFKSAQANEIIEYVRVKYGDELEFLWNKFPDNAVFRRKDNNKWYVAILTVAKSKLGLLSDEAVEIIDLRLEPEKMSALLENNNYYPGWHMNKKSWYTIILDGSVDISEIYGRIDTSYLLADKNPKSKKCYEKIG